MVPKASVTFLNAVATLACEMMSAERARTLVDGLMALMAWEGSSRREALRPMSAMALAPAVAQARATSCMRC
jgi:hypothetical protein